MQITLFRASHTQPPPPLQLKVSCFLTQLLDIGFFHSDPHPVHIPNTHAPTTLSVQALSLSHTHTQTPTHTHTAHTTIHKNTNTHTHTCTRAHIGQSFGGQSRYRIAQGQPYSEHLDTQTYAHTRNPRTQPNTRTYNHTHTNTESLIRRVFVWSLDGTVCVW